MYSTALLLPDGKEATALPDPESAEDGWLAVPEQPRHHAPRTVQAAASWWWKHLGPLGLRLKRVKIALQCWHNLLETEPPPTSRQLVAPPATDSELWRAADQLVSQTGRLRLRSLWSLLESRQGQDGGLLFVQHVMSRLPPRLLFEAREKCQELPPPYHRINWNLLLHSSVLQRALLQDHWARICKTTLLAPPLSPQQTRELGEVVMGESNPAARLHNVRVLTAAASGLKVREYKLPRGALLSGFELVSSHPSGTGLTS